MTKISQELEEQVELQKQVILQEQVELEDTIISLLASLWTMYDKLPILHPLDKRTFREALHRAQAIVLARPKMRGILMAQQGIQPEQQPIQQESVNQPIIQQVAQPVNPPVANPQIDSLSDQPVNIPLKVGEKACAVPIHGTGGMKTLPGVQ